MPEKSNNRVADEVTEAINRKSIKAENLMMSGLDLIEKFIRSICIKFLVKKYYLKI